MSLPYYGLWRHSASCGKLLSYHLMLFLQAEFCIFVEFFCRSQAFVGTLIYETCNNTWAFRKNRHVVAVCGILRHPAASCSFQADPSHASILPSAYFQHFGGTVPDHAGTCCQKWDYFTLLSVAKTTIHPGFSRTIPVFNDVSRKKITVLPGRPITPVFGLMSRICPDIDKLCCFTVQILILTCWSLFLAV